MAGIVEEINDSNFEEKVLKSNVPVVVDFWAPWCGPCKSIAPLLDQVAQDFAGKLLVCKVNVDDNAKSASTYMIRAIPNLVIFNNGAEVDRVVGAVSKEEIVAAVKKFV
jgi:thioredoxin 1